MASKNLDTSGNASEDLEMGSIPTERRGKRVGKETSTADRFFKFWDEFKGFNRHPTEPTTEDAKPASRRRHGIIPRAGHAINVSIEEILKPMSDHKEFSLHTIKLRGLAKFDNATNCGMDEKQEADLIRKEAATILHVAQSSEPPLFDSAGILAATDLKGYGELSGLADQILCNLEIIKHDNYHLVLSHSPIADIIYDAILGFKNSRTSLIRRYRNDKDHIEGFQPKTLDDPQQNLAAYFALVDYVLGVIAWWLMRTAKNHYWQTQLLIILAQWAVKLKAVAFDPVRCAERSLSDGEELMRQMLLDLEVKDALILKVRAVKDKDDKVSSDRKNVDVLDEEADLDGFYYMVKLALRRSLGDIIRHVLLNMIVADRAANGADTFEVCTLVYKTGLDRISTILCSDRDDDVSASMEISYLTYSYTAMLPLLKIATTLQTKYHASPTREDRRPTRLRWRVHHNSSDDSPTQELRVDKIDDIVSILVPLSLTSPTASQAVEGLIGTVAAVADDEDPIHQFEPLPREFEAEFTISTSEWIDKRHRMRQEHLHDPDVVPVSECPMRLGIRAGTELAHMMSTPSSSTSATIESRASTVIREYDAHLQQMRKWIVAENSITVDCRLYSRAAIALAAFVVLGSLVIPFTVGNKVVGVDPFQFVNFIWFAAGFGLIAAKSRYVNDWPWHDFLRGQVVCNSVRDLAEVTGIHAQMILLYLIHNEPKHTLTVSGPYRGIFKRKLEDVTGFVIDVPVHLSTMLASGYLIFKVLNEKGEHLICIDIRLGVRGITSRVEENYKASMDIGRDDFDLERKYGTDGLDKVIFLARQEFSWNKMLGLYVKDSKYG